MLKIRQYVRASSLEEAYELCQKKGSVILGGMLWLKMQDRSVNLAIDLCDLGLDTIEETDAEYRIGAMVSLRSLETHPGLAQLTSGAMADCLAPIIGVQFRNLATIGGSLWSRFGFSDPLTLFLALGAEVELQGAGRLPLAKWLESPAGRDLLVRVILPKTNQTTVYLSQRNTATDFPVLTCAVNRQLEGITCVVGARPARAKVFLDETGILAKGITPETAQRFADWVAETADFGSNLRAGEDYRRRLCRVLVRRAILKAEGL